ncbi:MAG TPA: GNAT family N-acetyltransferase [Clostridia bacterium]|nr:GNAT family N-acetyltransferase [Clostridia bacterium]
MIKRLDTKDSKIAEQIVDLQKRSYIMEAELIDFYDIPPLKDTIDTIIQCDEVFYGYYEDEVLAGLISYKLEEGLLDIYRVAVHPEYFRKGIARQMIEFIEDMNKGIERIIVSTGLKNQPAVSLYLKLGFRKLDEAEVEEDIYIVTFEKEGVRPGTNLNFW